MKKGGAPGDSLLAPQRAHGNDIRASSSSPRAELSSPLEPGLSVTVAPGEERYRLQPTEEISHLTAALQKALDAADPQSILKRKLTVKENILRAGSVRLDLSRFSRLIVIGGGKASGRMAAALEALLGSRIDAGVVNVPDYQTPLPRCRRIVLHSAAHPTPSAAGVAGVQKMLEVVGEPAKSDLIVCLISGGGSALMPLPIEGVGLGDLQGVTNLLLKSGAEIAEINTVRKHLSAISGGRLAQRLFPATVLSLVVSDVVGEALDTIASGPTSPDPTTYHDAESVLKKYSLWGRSTARVRDAISRGVGGRIAETPKQGSQVFKHVHNLVVASTRISCLATAKELRRRGYSTLVLSTRIRGEARDVGRLFADMLSDIVENHLPLRPPACIVAGGETTVTVRGHGIGGRNQELVMSAAVEMQGTRNVYVASLGTDGVDGPTTAAGAVADGNVVRNARMAGVDVESYLRENDSNTFLRKAGGLLLTGPTGTNVNDIMIAMASGA